MKNGDRIKIIKDAENSGIAPRKGEIYFITLNNDPEFITIENHERKQSYMLNKSLLGERFEIMKPARG